MPECVASGDHYWHGTSQCSACGARLRCVCGVYLREDNDTHISRCPVIEAMLQDERARIESTFA